jgi:hypothetical protein
MILTPELNTVIGQAGAGKSGSLLTVVIVSGLDLASFFISWL